MECITREVKNNWALKLSNLRRLKKNLDKYLEEELKISNSKLDKIDFPNIARTGNVVELLKLFDGVMYVILNCPLKTVFIRQIMELDESLQIQLMYFIQKVMGETEEPHPKDQDFHNTELETVKANLTRSSEQILELEHLIASLNEEQAEIQSKYQQLKFDNERLQELVSKKSLIEQIESDPICLELKARLLEKDDILSSLQKSFDKYRKDTETEISMMRDELDIACAKALEISNLEKTLQQYKKRLDTIPIMKSQIEELQKEKNEFNATLATQYNEIESLLKIKKNFNVTKELLDKEINKNETLGYNLESKEKLISKLEKVIIEYKQKVCFLEKQTEDLMLLDVPDSSHASDDSFHSTSNNFLKDFKQKTINPPTDHLESLHKELDKQRCLVQLKKNKLKCCKERLLMSFEEINTLSTDYHTLKSASESQTKKFQEKNNQLKNKILALQKSSESIEPKSPLLELDQTKLKLLDTIQLLTTTNREIQENNYTLSEEIKKLNDVVKDHENDKAIHLQILEELEQIKSHKTQLINENKNLNLEKENSNKKYFEAREEVSLLNSKISSKEIKISELELDLKLLQEEIKAYKEKENIYEKELNYLKNTSSPIQNQSDHILSLEKNLIELKTQISSLNISLEEKNEIIFKLKQENENVSEELKGRLEEAKQDFDNQLKIKNKEMVDQLEEAMSELTRQRELLAARLKSERKNTLVNFHRAMSIRDNGASNFQETSRLKDILADKDREIARLNRNNKEIKNCWRQSAKMLKAVWKELGNETKKIEDAVTERINY
jgi:protein HOOK3